MASNVVKPDDELGADLARRLKRIEGQAQGVQRMLEQGRSCMDILDQLKSIRSAAYGACLVLMKKQALDCLRNGDAKPSDVAVQEMMDLLLRLPH